MNEDNLIEGQFDIEHNSSEALAPEIQRSKFYNYALALTVALGGFHLGYYISIFGPFSDQFLEKNYQITAKSDRDSEIGTINLCFTLGCMVGAILGGYLLKWTGRIKSIILLECITRVLSGMLVGMFNTVCPSTNAEILPKEVSSFGGVMFYGSITTGILITSLFGQFISKDTMADRVAYFLVIPGIVSILRIILFLCVFNFESPVYIVEKYAIKRGVRISETAKADITGEDLLESLEKDSASSICGTNFSLDSTNSERIKKVFLRIFAEESIEGVTKDLVAKMDDTFSRKEISFGELFGPYYRKKFWIGIALNWFQQFNGINFFIMYATGAFNDKQAGAGDLINLIGAVVNWLSFIPTIYFSSKFGRRFNLFTGISLQFFAYLLGIIFQITDVPVMVQAIPVMLQFIGFGMGLGGTVFLYMSEFLPSIALGAALFWQWICTSLIAKFVPPFITEVGPMNLNYFFAVNCFTGAVLIWAFCVETKGKSQMEIHRDFVKA